MQRENSASFGLNTANRSEDQNTDGSDDGGLGAHFVVVVVLVVLIVLLCVCVCVTNSYQRVVA